MGYIRQPYNDWVVEVEGRGRTAYSAIDQIIIADNAVWLNGPHIGTGLGGSRYLYGLHTSDGSVKSTIDVTGLGGNLFDNGSKTIDQNGYIWTTGESGIGTGGKATRVLDVVNNQLIAQVGDQVSGNYGGTNLVFDPTNNLIWIHRTSSIVQSISTTSYTEVAQIAQNGSGGLALDYDKNELWIFNNTSNSILRYNATTRALNGTVSSSHTMNSVNARYIPSKKWVIVTDRTTLQIWSTETYTLVSSFTADSSDDFLPLTYHAPTNSFLTYYYDLDPDTFDTIGLSLRGYSVDSPHDYVTYQLPLLPSGVTTIAHEAITVDSAGNIYVGVDITSPGYTTYIYKLTFGEDCTRDNTIRDVTLCLTDSTTSNNNEVTNFDAFNRELVLDLHLGAFSIFDIAHTGDQLIRDYVDVPSFYVERNDVQLYVGNDPVMDGSGNPITTAGFISTVNRVTDNRRERFKFLITAGTSASLAEYRDYRFVDWYSIDGVGLPFNSYLLTGWELSGDMLRNKQTIYLKLFFERTEDVYTLDSDGNVALAHQSGCAVQAHWNWNNSAAQGKWGVPFQGYRLFKRHPTNPSSGDTFDYGERVIVTKNKLRGRGHCLSLLFVPGCGKDTKLLGWALDNTMNSTP